MTNKKSLAFSKDYKDVSSLQFAALKEVLANITPTNDTLSILDAGCGDGRVTAALSELYPNALINGIDISDELILYAKNRYGTDRLKFTVKDVRDIAGESKYDIVYSFFCLHLIPQKEISTVLLKLFKALKPGGEIYIAIPLRDLALEKIRRAVMLEFEDAFCDYSLPVNRNKEYYDTFLKEVSGVFKFEVEKTVVEFSPHFSADQFKKFFTSISRESRMIKGQQRRIAYIDRVVEQCVSDGCLSLDYKFTYIYMRCKGVTLQEDVKYAKC